ncbi:uncharacterized protein P174DRAFT_95183 [Aspergillus novofumigatus IBT 16806]|uniref:Uncharacterized protein n=1 Tax=Aspergillus novofumigatus (strain IBT 16806) TaxID=1392255 RepID=A0A2I1CH19_ASPN1|nr:uncharacterized protein P174DRAFT_95183 [Aspergillus novofumigatus IBT 16806]PKX96919.1 hypothetical protein P174DRAFT_95183 [Aspergillus novofumigatus IBT 16806]
MSFTKVSFPSNGVIVVGDFYAPAPGTPNRRGGVVVTLAVAMQSVNPSYIVN